jgi:hypothetical protein
MAEGTRSITKQAEDLQQPNQPKQSNWRRHQGTHVERRISKNAIQESAKVDEKETK